MVTRAGKDEEATRDTNVFSGWGLVCGCSWKSLRAFPVSHFTLNASGTTFKRREGLSVPPSFCSSLSRAHGTWAFLATWA